MPGQYTALLFCLVVYSKMILKCIFSVYYLVRFYHFFDVIITLYSIIISHPRLIKLAIFSKLENRGLFNELI